MTCEAKTFLWKGGSFTLAITKKRKDELVAQYSEWLQSSQAMIFAEYAGMSMKDLDALRLKVREVGGEFHIVKNTLGKLAFKEAGLPLPEGLFDGSTAVGFAFKDAPAMAKTVVEFAKTAEMFKIKGGFLESNPMNADSVRSLAALPPLPVMRAQLLGVLVAPASKLVRTLAEPARSIAAVIKAHAEPAEESASA